MNGNDPYNPVMHSDGTFKGVSIREQFAAMAMQSILRYGFDNAMGKGMFESIAKYSVTAADALIKALNETP